MLLRLLFFRSELILERDGNFVFAVEKKSNNKKRTK
jgi:hypothetical protein